MQVGDFAGARPLCDRLCIKRVSALLSLLHGCFSPAKGTDPVFLTRGITTCDVYNNNPVSFQLRLSVVSRDHAEK